MLTEMALLARQALLRYSKSICCVSQSQRAVVWQLTNTVSWTRPPWTRSDHTRRPA